MKPMKLRWILTAIIAGIIVIAIILYVAYQFDLINLKDFVTWVMAEMVAGFVAGIIGYLLGRKEKEESKTEELARAIAKESQELKEKEEAKKKREEQYLRHSNDLAELVFKIWQCSPWDLVDNDLFPNACEHLESGYPDLWRVWSDKENGYKALSLRCDNQKESIRKSIEGKLKDEIEVKFSYTFKSDQLSWLVVDIYDHIEYKVTIGRDRFYFEVEIKENRPPSIVSIQKEADHAHYRSSYNLESSSRSDLEKIAEILNSLLTDVKLNDAMKNFGWKKAETARKLKQFRDGLKSIISTAEYGFKGIDGECSGKYGCKDWKP